jgi:DNA-binding winged helix-turn-helix (wHTH) protein/tetratricopeptide (TPR) repeat protein
MRYTFEDFSLDTSTRELKRAGSLIATSPKTFDVLTLLIERCDTVITREVLLELVWKKKFVSESTLNSQMNSVRLAVNDDGRSQRLIRTVPKKGFRFIGRVLAPSAGKALEQASTRHAHPAVSFGAKATIVVSPFRNLTLLPELSLFAAGLTDDITGVLTRISGLAVQHPATLPYPEDGRSRAMRAGTDFVVEGSVRQSHDQLRVSVQLVDVNSGTCVWATRLDGDALDPFGLQDRLLTNVAMVFATYFDRRALEQMRLARSGPTTSDEFYETAMIYVRRGTRTSIGKAVPYLLRAIELDEANAKARSAAAWSYVWLKLLRGSENAPVDPIMVIQHARTAVEMDCDDPIVLIQSAYALGHFEGDLGSTLSLFDRALALDPNNPLAWSLSGAQLISAGSTANGLDRIQRATAISAAGQELGNIAILKSLGNLVTGNLGASQKFAREAMVHLPQAPQSSAVLAASLALTGEREEAASAMRMLRTLTPTLRASGVSRWVNLQAAGDLAVFKDGLIRAGLPK